MREDINSDEASGGDPARRVGEEVHYEIRVRFTTDRRISEAELGDMMNAVAVRSTDSLIDEKCATSLLIC